jgi:hypothetical protein
VKRTVTALAITGMLATAGPVSGDTRGCVSQREFNRIQYGMTKRNVHRIFDTRGRRVWLRGAQERRVYRYCSGARSSTPTRIGR